MKFEVIKKAQEEPISLEDAKLFLRVDSDEEDDLIKTMITTARELAEGIQGRTLPEQELKAYFDSFPSKGDPLKLPRPPVKEIKEVKYTDRGGDTQELTEFEADLHAEPALIYADWPETKDRPNAVEVEYDAGYDEIPRPTVQGIVLMLGHFYEIREPVAIGTIATQIPFSVEMLLRQHKVWW